MSNNVVNEWYGLKNMLSYTWARFYFLIGAREAGKSYSLMEYCIAQFFQKGKTFIWVRLKQKQIDKLKDNNAAKLFDGGIRRKYKVDMELVKVKGDEVFYDGKLMCKLFCLSTFYNDKGVAIFDDEDFGRHFFSTNIVLDEFQREKNERKDFDIVYAFKNQLENLIRSRQDVRIWLVGNTVEEASDILLMFNFIPEHFGVYKLKKMKCVIHNIQPTDAYKLRRSKSLVNLLDERQKSSTFTNEIKIMHSLLIKKGERPFKPTAIFCFDNAKFTVWDSHIIMPYKKENVKKVALEPLVEDIPFHTKIRNMVVEQAYLRKFKFASMFIQKSFDIKIRNLRKVG